MSKWIVDAHADTVEAIEVNGVKYVPERTCKPVIAEDGANEGCRVCSECGRLYWSTPFCPYCGAKVVGE